MLRIISNLFTKFRLKISNLFGKIELNKRVEILAKHHIFQFTAGVAGVLGLLGAYNILPYQNSQNSLFYDWVSLFGSDAQKETACDDLASDPDDILRKKRGFIYVETVNFPSTATSVCSAAVVTHQSEPRFRHQRGRAFQAMHKMIEAQQDYKVAADAGYGPSQAWMGEYFLQKEDCVAFEWFARARDRSATAKYWMGIAKFEGIYERCGIQRQKEEGAELIIEAAAFGNKKAETSSQTFNLSGR